MQRGLVDWYMYTSRPGHVRIPRREDRRLVSHHLRVDVPAHVFVAPPRLCKARVANSALRDVRLVVEVAKPYSGAVADCERHSL